MASPTSARPDPRAGPARRAEPRRKNRAHRRRGFTLLEVLVAASITTVIVAGALTAFTTLLRTSQAARLDARETQLSRFVHEQLAADVRSTVRVATAEAGRLSLVVRNFDDATEASGRSVIYAYDAAARTLTRSQGNQSKVLLTGLASCSFTYRQRTTAGASQAPVTAAAVNAITLSYRLSTTGEPFDGGSGQALTTATFQCRNLLLP